MIYAILILGLIVSLYAAGNYMLYTIPLVEAGPISGIKHTGLRKTNERIRAVYNRTINNVTYRYRHFIVQGICMIKIGIKPGDLISVRMIDSQVDKSKLDKGTPVLIYLNDNKFRGYKIRIVKEIIDGDRAKTFYFNTDGSEHESSDTHSLKSIIGIVDLKESGIVA